VSQPIFLIPIPAEGYEWASVELGVDITTASGGKEFVKTIKGKGIKVIVDPDKGMAAQWYPKQILDANADTEHKNGEAAEEEKS